MAGAPRPNVLCPLCGDANACAPARIGRFDEPCWCEAVSIGAALLDRVDESLRGVACLCPACVAASMAEPPASARPTHDGSIGEP